MTLGQRIAQKRKEKNLSQEALGDALGVSRQSIYKWESDSALPEIEKLITLSKLFGVPVGWLLGVEEEAALSQNSPELTEQQLKMVEEITERYLAARPKPKSRKWLYTLAAFTVLLGVLSLVNRLDQINQQYHRVQMTVSHVQDSVDAQINGIASQVEDILKAQNNLTADYDTEFKRADLSANAITFFVRATPKTYVDGMTAQFSAENSLETTTVTVDSDSHRTFSTEISCELTDEITLSVTFLSPDGTSQTQVLDTYEYLYNGSMPSVSVHTPDLMFADAPDGHLTLPACYASVVLEPPDKELGIEPVTVSDVDVKVGLFVDKKLLMWAVPSPAQGTTLFKFSALALHLNNDTELYVAAVVTDQFGRTAIGHDIPYILDSDGSRLTHPDYSETDSDPANWTY